MPVMTDWPDDAAVKRAIGELDYLLGKHGTPDAVRVNVRAALLAAGEPYAAELAAAEAKIERLRKSLQDAIGELLSGPYGEEVIAPLQKVLVETALKETEEAK